MSSHALTQATAREPRVTSMGLHLRADLGFEEWVLLGRRIARVAAGSAWSLGDWLNYGERAFGARYRAALDATQFDYQTLRNLAWVARAFDLSRRRDDLSFSHHAEVASLSQPEQELWLTRAQTLGWSRNELRRRLAQHYARTRPALSPAELRLPLDAERERRWREAAAAAHQGLTEWVAAALDAAAEAVLDPPRSTAA